MFAAATARQTRRQADAAHTELHLAYAPVLAATLEGDSGDSPDWLYEIRNDGRRDLDSVTVCRPATLDRVRYPVARLGSEFGDNAELGRLPIGTAARLLLHVGTTTSPPEFRVDVVCRSDDETWTVSVLLEPRPQPFQIR